MRGHPQGNCDLSRLPQILPPRQIQVRARRGSPRPGRAQRDATEPGEAARPKGRGRAPCGSPRVPQPRRGSPDVALTSGPGGSAAERPSAAAFIAAVRGARLRGGSGGPAPNPSARPRYSPKPPQPGPGTAPDPLSPSPARPQTSLARPRHGRRSVEPSPGSATNQLSAAPARMGRARRVPEGCGHPG